MRPFIFVGSSCPDRAIPGFQRHPSNRIQSQNQRHRHAPVAVGIAAAISSLMPRKKPVVRRRVPPRRTSTVSLAKIERAVEKAISVQLQLVNQGGAGWWPVGQWSLGGSNLWWPIIRESSSGAWQRNEELAFSNILSFPPIYRCITLISTDVGKLRVKLVEQVEDGIWTETQNPAFSPVLRKPNRYQNRIEFYQWWMTSKLIHGNTYALKQRDERGIVIGLYILDPTRVKVLVSPDGSVFYQLAADNLSGLTEEEAMIPVPASEMIHDKYVPLYHPLIGVPPVAACVLSGQLGLKIQNDALNFFSNNAQPGGILTAPQFIKDETAKRLKEQWDMNFSGQNAGKVAVLGDGLKFEPMRQTAKDAELVEVLKLTGLDVCIAFGVPPYKIGIGDPPNFNNIEALNQQYYSECLQVLIETVEIHLDEGLGMARNGAPQVLGTEFDIENLLRMDTATRVKAAGDSIGGAGMTINEARRRYFDLPRIAGGDTVWLQQQNWPVQTLAERTLGELLPKAPEPAPTAEPDDEMTEDDAKVFRASFKEVLAA